MGDIESNDLVYHLNPKTFVKMFTKKKCTLEEKLIQDILKYICALRNSGGGKLTILFTKICLKSAVAKKCVEIIKNAAYKVLSDTEKADFISGSTSLRKIIFSIKGSKEIVTMKNNINVITLEEEKLVPSTKSAAEVMRFFSRDRSWNSGDISAVVNIRTKPNRAVFVEVPESYHVVDNSVKRLPFSKWIARLQDSTKELDRTPFVELKGLKHKWFDTNIFKENAGMSEKFKDELGRLEWVESFKIVDANNECNESHLEIVCKFGKVPRTADIVNIFGKEIFPFITYQEGLKHKWFETNIFKENLGMYEKFKDELMGRLEWVESFKIVDANEECNERHLEIVCKFGKVPRTADIVSILGEKMLPLITYQEGSKHKWFETNIFKENAGMSEKFKDELGRLEWVESFKTVGANKECNERHLEIVYKFGKVPRTADIVKIFGKENLPFITYQEGLKHKWFETNIFKENAGMYEKFMDELERLEWVVSFKIVDANKECNERHLEIVCKLGKVPRTCDIVNIFGRKDILPFITYKECSKREWFETNILSENSGRKKKYKNELTRLEWVESSKIVDANKECNARHLEIVCKLGKVPRTADIVKLFGEEILPFITYQERSKHEWFETNILDENSDMKEKYKVELARLQWVKSSKIVDANEECNERHLEIVCKFGQVPRTPDIVKLFGKEILPLIIYQEGSKDEWFDENIFDGNYDMKEEYVKKLASESFPWVKNFYIGFEKEQEKTWQIYITCAQNKVPCMVDLKKLFGVNIASFVDFIQESVGESLTSSSFLRGPSSGDDLYVQNETLGCGTLGILAARVLKAEKHYAITCYHVCYQHKLPKYMDDAHKLLKGDCAKNEQKGCVGVRYQFKDGEVIVPLGRFSCGLYNDKHDIALVELTKNLNCDDAVALLEEDVESTLLSKKDVWKIFKEMGGNVPVKKYGSETQQSEGQLTGITRGADANGRNNGFYEIKGIETQVFAKKGDSGSLVYMIYRGRNIPFAYVSNKEPDKDVHYCPNLSHSINALNGNRDGLIIHPCFNNKCGRDMTTRINAINS